MHYVPTEFRESIERHLAGNILIDATESPLILGIFGPPGEGKTFQSEQVCKSLGVSVLLVSPGELESENAGHPGQLLRREYLRAGDAILSGQPSVLMINDIDTVIGDWGNLVQYTVNRQVVYGQLMSFCDFPNEVSGTPTRRVPILFTGNNPSILYGPLMRPGRMRLYRWKPSLQTKIPVVRSILPELDAVRVERLVQEHPLRPVSFWSDVRAAAWEREITRWLRGQGPAQLATMLRSGSLLRLDKSPISFDVVQTVAAELAKAADVSDESFLDGALHGGGGLGSDSHKHGGV